MQTLPPQNEERFPRTLVRWVDRASISFAIIGGLSTIILVIFYPATLASSLIFFGTLAILHYLGSKAAENDPDNTSVAKIIGFYSTKLMAFVPVAVLIFMSLQLPELPPPRHKNHVLFWISNTLFFGAMAAALIVKGGWSSSQYFQSELRGLNRFNPHAFRISLVLCGIGFVLKWLNEP